MSENYDEMLEEMAETGIDEISDRPIEVITEEINFYKNTAGAAILEIGKRLLEAKSMLNHGEWGEWLKEKVEFSEVTAQRFMRLAKEYRNPSPVMDLGVSKALILLALPTSEREGFATEKHTVNGEEKTASEMTKKELEKAIQEKKEKDAVINDLKTELEELRNSSKETDAELEEAKEEIEALKQEANSVPEVSAEQIDEIKKEAENESKERIEKLNAKIEKLTEQKKALESAEETAKQKIEDFKSDYEKKIQAKDSRNNELQKEISELKAKITMSSSTAVTEFKIHFENLQNEIDKLANIVSEVKDNDLAAAEKLKSAMKQVASNINSTF